MNVRKHLGWIGLLVALLGCDEKPEKEPAAVFFEEERYVFSNGLVEEWGAHSGNHYNLDFTLVGSEALFVEQTDVDGSTYFTFSEDPDFYLFFELFSSGQENFEEGEFLALGTKKLSEAPEENIFRTFFWGRSLAEQIRMTGGRVIVSKSSKGTYMIEFHVVTSDGQILSGTYRGIPHYLDQR